MVLFNYKRKFTMFIFVSLSGNYDKICFDITCFIEGEYMSNRIVRGTLLLTAAGYISRFLGMIYVIPFNALVGAKGIALYSYAYIPYTVLISLSTVGIPPAISKMVAKYNSLNQAQIGLKVFRMSFYLMMLTGLLAFLLLFISAEWIANIIVANKDPQGNSVDDVTKVIQMVSFALIIIPAMSSVRGFFQGNQSMGPTAVSQVVEQIIRIAFLLIAGFIVIVLLKGSYVNAVGFATFAAFVGAIASCAVLFYYWRKRKSFIMQNVAKQRRSMVISTKSLILELLSYSIPFILVGIATPLYQLIDLFTFNRAMEIAGFGNVSELSFAAINVNGNKLVIIPVMIATGLSLTLVPALTESFTKKNHKKLVKETSQAIQIVLFVVIPAVFGLIALAPEAYGSFFSMEDLDVTGRLLAWYAPMALIFALFTVSSAILQGINQQRFAIISLSAGFLVKLLLNSFLIQTFGAIGSIIATGLALGTAVFVNVWRIKSVLNFSFLQTYKRTLFVIIFSIVMYFAVLLSKWLFGFFLPFDESRLAATVMLLIGVAVGVVVYFILTYKSTLLDAVLEQTSVMDKLRRKLSAFR